MIQPFARASGAATFPDRARPIRVSVALAFLVVAFAGVARAQNLVPRTQPALAYPEGERAIVDVTVRLELDEQGDVVVAAVIGKVPPESAASFDDAALAFARALAFEPVLADGKPSRVGTEIRLHFEPAALGQDDASGPVTDPHRHEVHDDMPPPIEPSPVLSPALPPVKEMTGRVRSTRPATAAGDFHLHVGQLGDVPRTSAAQLLTLAPGILLTNHGGEGHAPAIFLRGFDAGEGQDLEFRLDGMPLNEISNAHSHGYADAHFIIPELVDELRVIEGSFDARQGDFAVAGTAEYHLSLHERGLQAKTTYGSFGTRRGLVLWGPEGAEDGTFAGVELKQSDGFGINRASGSASAMAGYEARLGTDTVVHLLAQSYAAHFDSAGVLRQDDFDARRLPCAADEASQFFCTYDPNQGGAVSRHGLQARLVRRLEGATLEQFVGVATRHLRLRENFTGFLGDARGDNSEKLYDATTFAARGSLQTSRRWHELRQELEVGYFARWDRGDTSSRRLLDSGGQAYRRDIDQGFDVTDIALYATGALRPTSALTLRGGLRAESFAFSTLNRMPPRVRGEVTEPTLATDAFGLVLLPRVTAQWKLRAGLEWMTSWGMGARSSDALALSDGEFAPFHRVTGAETGLLFERAGGEDASAWTLSGRSSLYWTRVDRALVFDETLARNALTGPTNRFGALALGRVGYGGWFDSQLSVTWAEAYKPPADAALYELTAGERQEYVPRFVTRLDTSARRSTPLFGEDVQLGAALGVTHIAPRPLPLGKESDPIFTVDLGLSARCKQLELGLSAQNLLDARYRLAEFNYASNFGDPELQSKRASRHFAAGAPRTVLATVAWHFGGPGDSADDQAHDVHQEEAP